MLAVVQSSGSVLLSIVCWKKCVIIGVNSFDSDGQALLPHNYPRDMSKIGILTQDLNIGDTTITYSADAPVFNGSLGYPDSYLNNKSHMRQVFGYKKQPNGDLCYVADGVNQSGRIYEHHAYTNYGSYTALGRFSNTADEVDNGDGTYTLTLNVPWDTVNLKIGDAVVRTNSGGNFSYWISQKFEKVDGKFHKYASPWKLFNDSNYGANGVGGYAGMFRNGTAAAKIMALFNFSHYDKDGKYVAGATNYVGYYAKMRLEWRYPQNG